MGKARALMVQGTGSYAGKTLLVTAFCKIFADMGYRVAPFKAQNMSLNSYVTADGAEIARAQALQALAAGIEPTAHMNPILLKPKGNITSQIMLLGRPYRDIAARDYFSQFAMREGIKTVRESLQLLRGQYDIIVIEGAGSPAEPNLYDFEIANMKVADLADAPVLLVADIDRGGAFASLLGTLTLLKEEHRNRVRGLVINKFRGDMCFLRPALRKIKEITGKPVLGVIPYIEGLDLPGEDSVSLESVNRESHGALDIVVIRLPRISNFTDFDPLQVGGASVRFVRDPEDIGDPAAIIIPGTKNTVQDLLWIRERGLDDVLQRLNREGVPVLGICGGYQILGKKILDSKGIEGGVKREVAGLGLLDVKTTFDRYDKTTNRVKGEIVGRGPIVSPVRGQVLHGYEIHMGKTSIGSDHPLLRIFDRDERDSSRLDGAVSKDGLVLGCYLHGVFDDPPLRISLLSYLTKASRLKVAQKPFRIQDIWAQNISRLVESVKKNVDVNEVCRLIGLSG